MGLKEGFITFESLRNALLNQTIIHCLTQENVSGSDIRAESTGRLYQPDCLLLNFTLLHPQHPQLVDLGHQESS